MIWSHHVTVIKERINTSQTTSSKIPVTAEFLLSVHVKPENRKTKCKIYSDSELKRFSIILHRAQSLIQRNLATRKEASVTLLQDEWPTILSFQMSRGGPHSVGRGWLCGGDFFFLLKTSRIFSGGDVFSLRFCFSRY